MVVLSCLITLLTSISLNIGDKQTKGEPVNTVSSVTYIVKEHNGQIGIFIKGNDIPFETYNVAVDYLPEDDKACLKAGIEVTDPQKLYSIIEDYIS
jgi:hypothetical protein